jgi:hypothetical protein
LRLARKTRPLIIHYLIQRFASWVPFKRQAEAAL